MTTKSEKFVKDILDEEYKKVYKVGFDFGEVDEDYLPIRKYLGNKLTVTGSPDIIAWNSKEDYKFVEVKFNGDTVKESFIGWLSDNQEENVEIWRFGDYDKEAISVQDLNNLASRQIPEDILNATSWIKSGEFGMHVNNDGNLVLEKK